jgi:hypothetical protein
LGGILFYINPATPIEAGIKRFEKYMLYPIHLIPYYKDINHATDTHQKRYILSRDIRALARMSPSFITWESGWGSLREQAKRCDNG